MKKIVFLIAIIAVTSACGVIHRAPQDDTIKNETIPTTSLIRTKISTLSSTTPEEVAKAINEGIMVEEDTPAQSSSWEELSEFFPPKRNEPAWGLVLYDLDRDGLLDQIFYQFKRSFLGKIRLKKLAIKSGRDEWKIPGENFIKEVEDSLDDIDYD